MGVQAIPMAVLDIAMAGQAQASRAPGSEVRMPAGPQAADLPG